MTLAFKWRSWYLFGYCTLRQDYRLFRLGRIGDLEALRKPFHRRDRSFEDFFARANPWGTESWIEIELRFDPFIRPVVEEFYEKEDMEDLPDGSLLVRTRLPEDGWVYGLILSYGKYVEVISPPHLRKTIRKAAGDIFDLYE